MISSFHSNHDAASGTIVGSGGTTQFGDTLVEVSADRCHIRFNGHLMCLGGPKCRKQGYQKYDSSMEQEPVVTNLAKKTRMGKLVDAVAGKKISPLQVSAVKEDHREPSWAMAEALRCMAADHAGQGLDYQDHGVAHGDEDPPLGTSPGRL
jgi:hypothetical protein